jgi:hypothetical protein
MTQLVASHTVLDGEVLGSVAVPDEGSYWLPWVAGVVWGAGTMISALWSEGVPRLTIDGLTLLVTALLLLFVNVRIVALWVMTPVGLLLVAHGAAAFLSATIHDAPFFSVGRYGLLAPAYAMILGCVDRGWRSTRGLRGGLTVAAFSMVLYQLPEVDFTRFLDPISRTGTLMSVNSIAFISAMACISLLDYALVRTKALGRSGILGTSVLWMAVGASLLVCLATKSRTGTLALLAGGLLRLYFWMGMTRAFLGLLAILVLATGFLAGWISDLGDTVAVAFGLFQPDRSIYGGTGRFAAWGIIVDEIWLPNFWLGVGPVVAGRLIFRIALIPGAHNGLLAILADIGTLGALPILVILGMAVRGAWRWRHEPASHFPIVVLVGAVVESFAEQMFFSIGNPASLMFLLSIAMLTQGGSPESAPHGGSLTA